MPTQIWKYPFNNWTITLVAFPIFSISPQVLWPLKHNKTGAQYMIALVEIQKVENDSFDKIHYGRNHILYQNEIKKLFFLHKLYKTSCSLTQKSSTRFIADHSVGKYYNMLLLHNIADSREDKLTKTSGTLHLLLNYGWVFLRSKVKTQKCIANV